MEMLLNNPSVFMFLKIRSSTAVEETKLIRMAREEIEALVEGGQASAGPPLGPALGPLGINVGEVVSEINKKTSSYDGMTIPVKVVVDEESGYFEIEVGSPPTAALIRNELGIDRGAGDPEEIPAGDLDMSQVVSIVEKKKDDILAKDKKKAAKEILGTCVSMGIYAEGKDPRVVQKEVEEGKYDDYFEG